MRRRPATRGFTLLEVVVSLAILAVSLVMLLTTNAASLNNTSRARDITVATLLARSKMIDIEQMLFDDGFQLGEQVEDGDFSDEGHKEIKWKATITQVELDLDGLTSMCEGFMGDSDSDDGTQGNPCEDMLGGMGAMPGFNFVDDIGNALRLVELEVTWPVGQKYHESMKVSGLVTREDLSQPAGGTGLGNTNGGTSGGTNGGTGGISGAPPPNPFPPGFPGTGLNNVGSGSPSRRSK